MPRFSGVEFLGTTSSSSPQQFAKDISCIAMKRTGNKCINNDGQEE